MYFPEGLENTPFTLGLPDTFKLMFAIGSSMEKKDEEFGKFLEKLSIVVRRAYFD